MTDISKEAVDLKLRALFASPKGVEEFVDIQEIVYTQSARIAELEAQQAKDWKNINLKADAIDAWINTSAGQYQRIEELTADLVTARADALQEAANICDAERRDAAKHGLPQMALGALACRRSIVALIASTTDQDGEAP